LFYPELSRANLPNVKNILSNLDSSDKSGNNRPREGQYTDKKENKIFLLYMEIQMGSGAKSYMRKGFLIYVQYEEMYKYLHHI
jgi:hypothetical protein